MMKLPQCVGRLRLSRLFRCLAVLCVLKLGVLVSMAVFETGEEKPSAQLQPSSEKMLAALDDALSKQKASQNREDSSSETAIPEKDSAANADAQSPSEKGTAGGAARSVAGRQENTPNTAPAALKDAVKEVGSYILHALVTLPGADRSAHAAPAAAGQPKSEPLKAPDSAAKSSAPLPMLPPPTVKSRPFDPAAPQGTAPVLPEAETPQPSPAQGQGGSDASALPPSQPSGGERGIPQASPAMPPAAAPSSAPVPPMPSSANDAGAQAPAPAAIGRRGDDVMPQFRDSSAGSSGGIRSAGMRSAEDESQELARREQEVLMLKQQVDQRIKDLENAENRVKDMLREARSLEDEKIKRMVLMYSNMKPKVAAKAFESMDERIAVRILMGLQSKQAGEILSYANPKTSAKLTELMTRMRLPQ